MRQSLYLILLLTIALALLSGCIQRAPAKPAETGSTTLTTTTTENSTTTTTTVPTTTQQPWKTAYLNYIKTLDPNGYTAFRLVYVDGDNVPELFVSGSCEAAGSIVCTYNNGTVNSVHLNRLGGCSYVPKSGQIHNFNGNMGYYTATVFRLSNGKFTQLFNGLEIVDIRETTGENGDPVYEEVSSYSIGDRDVTEEEFWNAQAAVFDFDRAEELYEYNSKNMYSRRGIQTVIKNW